MVVGGSCHVDNLFYDALGPLINIRMFSGKRITTQESLGSTILAVQEPNCIAQSRENTLNSFDLALNANCADHTFFSFEMLSGFER